MMRSLYSGVSGLRVHQTKMDVIGNNIANVNTVGFKASSVSFSDIFYQTTQGATGPNAETGAAGRNAMQIGLGANLSSIKASFTTGGAQRTDNPFDLMINGDSFFVVKSGGSNYFTKAGSFGIDANGTLSTPSGATVMGRRVDPNDSNKIEQKEVSELQIMSPENLYAKPEATTQAYITGNIDKNDTQLAPDATGKTVNLSFYDSMGYSYTADIKVNRAKTANNPTNADNIYSTSITDIKSNGESIFVAKDGDKFKASGITSIVFEGVTYTAAVNVDTGAVTLSPDSNVVMQFNSGSGKFEGIGTGANPTGTGVSLLINSTATQGAANPFEKINIDFSSVTMQASSGSTSLESKRGSLDGLGAGKKRGNLSGVGIDTAGKIYGKYDNGDSKLLGQVAVAEFSNPAGLEAVGNSMFATTQNSGDFDGVGKDISASGGGFTSGVLEMSNVDLSAQFTDMITTQRGFQANSRIITTSDTMLEELINLKR